MSAIALGAGCPEDGRHLLRIGGITPFSTVDWPGKLACVAFLAGCPWDCPYCQNHMLRSADAGRLDECDLYGFLETRRGLLDGVVFSGGEPLVQTGLIEAVGRVRELGFEVGLHTCGAFPDRLRELVPLLDWVGIDVKAPWDSYDRVTRVAGSGERARESLDIIREAGVAMEARTTWHPALLSLEDIAAIGHDLAARSVRTWAIQAYRSQGTSGELPDDTVYPGDVPDDLPALFDSFEFRRA